MPFDPDAYLSSSPPAASGGFDPDAYLGNTDTTARDAARGVVMGGAKGASFGFNDELGGFVGAVGEKLGLVQSPEAAAAEELGRPAPERSFGDAYKWWREGMRDTEAEAQKASPKAFGASEFAGAVANPIGAAGKGAGALARISKAADVGALSGLGNSTADLAEGDVSGAFWDTALGAATGAATAGALESAGAGVSKIAGGAAGRQAARNVDALLEKTPAVRTQDKATAVLGGKEGISRVLKEEGLEPYVRKAKDGLALAEEKLDDVGSEIGSIYAKADQKFPQGVASRSEVYDRLGQLLDGYAEKDQVAKFTALKSMMGKLETMDSHLAQGAETADRPMSAQGIFELKKQLNQIGYTGASDIAPQEAKQAARDAGEIIRDLLAERVDAATGEAKRLGELNSRWRDLNQIRDVFEAKATRDARMSPSLGERMASAGKNLVDAGAVAGALSTGHWGALAAPVVMRAAPYAPRAADSILISLANAAKSTGDPMGLIQRAVQLGIPEETASAIVRQNQGQGAQPY